MKRVELLLTIFGAFTIQFSVAQTNVFPASGNVGIGVSNPSEKLEVEGNVRAKQINVVSSDFQLAELGPQALRTGLGRVDATVRSLHYELSSDWDAAQIQLRAGSSSGTRSTLRLQGNWNGHASDGKGGLYFGPNGVDTHVMLHNGNVGIGTLTPDSKLSVNGNIRAREIKVETSGWPDYVFETDFSLPSLADTERFINKHGHLPDVPKAAEVEANGVSLGEMNKILLQKIEEITLHLIDMEKKNLQQQKMLDELLTKVNN